MSEPTTEAGRRLFTDNEPMDMLESNGVTWDDILAIEAEARASLLHDIRTWVETVNGASVKLSTGEYIGREDILAKLDDL